ncbi:MAG: hypothetical protein BM564_01770 [Bacteroidetes bacterium MedPE-SWsnd-G2]|nr:MAG: hypothetical protein BM564_01770 [Bacteroidetes bacterium MedPE-SWsnd-G2]
MVLGLLIGLIFSYLTYFVGLLSFIITASGNQDKGISNNITIGEWINIDLAFTFTVMIIAPFLTMIVQKSIYKNTNSKLSNSIIAVTIVIITIISFFINHQQTNYVFDIFSLWHIICLFGLQLIINQTQLLKLIKI